MRTLSLRQLIWGCLAVITVFFATAAAISFFLHNTVAQAVNQLSGHLQPTQNNVVALSTAYVDQETGQRGYLLTGDPESLAPYTRGITTAENLMVDLRVSLAGDPEANRRLDGVARAASAWNDQAAQPQIAARRAGPIPPDQLKSMTLTGRQLFDAVRAQLAALDTRTDEMVTAQLHRIRVARRFADIVEITSVGLSVIVVAISVVMFQRQLTRPVDRLLRDVRTVADGDYDHQIRQGGPREIALLSDATETMRGSLRASAKLLAEAERRDEQARMAADLHDRIIQRVFGLGLGLTSATKRRSPDLTPFITETDEIIRDLRHVIFDLNEGSSSLARGGVRLRIAIIDMVENSAATLGFTPTLDFEGPIDDCANRPGLQAAALAVLQESLSNVARHANATAVTVRVVATGDEFLVVVSDDGTGLAPTAGEGHGLPNIFARAEHLDGGVNIRKAGPDGGTIVEWKVPTAPGNR